MPEAPPLDLPENPKLAANLLWFCRALRSAGLPVGPGHAIGAARALAEAGVADRTGFYWTLRACLTSKPEQAALFDQVFRLFWRDPRYLEHMMAMMLPALRGSQPPRAPQAAERRAAEALTGGRQDRPEAPEAPPVELQIDASGTAAATERLRSLDFEQMDAAEIAEARRMIARLSLPVRPIPSRRTGPDPRGPLPDWRATMRHAARHGGEPRQIMRRARRQRWPSLVALCDISGSMSAYSRMVLHFLHAVSNRPGPGWGRVHAFTFGTRLTNITRHLRARDVDQALAAAGAEAQDWEGGTRIGDSLAAFNRDWSRRVMGQGAVVLLITDGLERGDPAALGAAIERLSLSARQVIWLNPLLRWDGFAPKARGVRAILPHVDSLRAGHSVASLEGLAAALGREGDLGEKARIMGRGVGTGRRGPEFLR